MPRGSAEQLASATTLREQAARARRLISSLTADTDRRKLLEFAESMEAEAEKLERAADSNSTLNFD